MALEDLNRTASDRSSRILFWALFFSILAHCLALLFYSLYTKAAARRFQMQARILESIQRAQLKNLEAEQKRNPQAPLSEEALTFLDTDPLLSQMPVKPTKFIGANNSRAANAEPIKSKSPDPTIRGTQKVIKQFVEEGTPMPLPPSIAPDPTPQTTAKKMTEEPFKPDQKTPEKMLETQTKPEEKYLDPLPPKNFGDTAKLMARGTSEPISQPSANSKPATEKQRPRRLADVRGVSNAKMASEGNAGETAPVSSFDVQLTGFGAYDAQLLEAVRQSWYELIDTIKPQGTGTVVITFNLHSDGSISQVGVQRNNSGNGMLENVAIGAIRKPAPFAKWPSSMVREIGATQTQIIFTFYYL